MSLLRPIIRCCVCAALRDRTYAEDRVFDSDQRPLAAALLNLPKSPYIVVFTDADDTPTATEGRMYDGRYRQLQVSIEIGVASAIEHQDGSVTIKLASNDYASEWAVDVVEAQVKAALYGDPQSDWGELLKRFAPRVALFRSRRGGQNQQGVRFNARRLVLTLSDMLDDFAPGRPVPQVVTDFIALAAAHPQLSVSGAGHLVSDVLSTLPATAPTWRQAQAFLGTREDVVKALNVTDAPLPYPGVEEAPYDAQDAEQPPALADIGIVDDRDAEMRSDEQAPL